MYGQRTMTDDDGQGMASDQLKTFKMVSMEAIMDTILMEMSKM